PGRVARSRAGLLVVFPSLSSPLKGLYNPRAFITHAAWLDQACAPCPLFPTAGSRRRLCRVSRAPHGCLRWAVGPCLSPREAGPPLRPATDRRLGEPLPHQQANRTRAVPSAINLSPEGRIRY